MSYKAIDVEQQDIDKGVRYGPRSCAISQAVMRQLTPEELNALHFTGTYRRFNDDNETEIYLHTGMSDNEERGPLVEADIDVNEWVRSFDNNGPGSVEPFSFKVYLPEDINE